MVEDKVIERLEYQNSLLREIIQRGDGLISRNDVCKIFGVSRATVYRYQSEIGFTPGDKLSRVTYKQAAKFFHK